MDEFHFTDQRLFGLHTLPATETATRERTRVALAGADVTTVNAINLLYRFGYYLVEPVVIDSDEHWFSMLARGTYLRLPNSLKALRDLWWSGYYLEALAISRHILEGWVQVRYFDSHKGQVRAHAMATTRRDRVSFKDMFEFAAVGSYDVLYSIPSMMAHGGIAANMFREEHTGPTDVGRVIHGCEYDDTYSKYVLSVTLGIAYAFIRAAPTFFPSLPAVADAETLAARETFVGEYAREWYAQTRTVEQQDLFDRVLRPFTEL